MAKARRIGNHPPHTRIIPVKLSFNYKRDRNGTMENCKSRGSMRGDGMLPGVHYDSKSTSAPMVDRIAARMVVRYTVDKGWHIDHIDVKSAFLHGDYLYNKSVYIREVARSDRTYKHGKTVRILILNLYGNPTGTYYYVKCLLKHLR